MITVTLTQEEIADRARSLAQYANKLAKLSDEEEGAKARHKQLMADIKERRLDIGNELRRLSRAVRLGVEERNEQRVLFEEERRLEEFRRERETEEQQQASKEAVAEFFDSRLTAEEMTLANEASENELFGADEIEARAEAEAQAEMSGEAVAVKGLTKCVCSDYEDEHTKSGGYVIAACDCAKFRAAPVEGEEVEDWQTEWAASLSIEERQRFHSAPCSCGHNRIMHDGKRGASDGICLIAGCKCKHYHCPDCDTKGGHQATCEHYVLGEGTPIQKEERPTTSLPSAATSARRSKAATRRSAAARRGQKASL